MDKRTLADWCFRMTLLAGSPPPDAEVCAQEPVSQSVQNFEQTTPISRSTP